MVKSIVTKHHIIDMNGSDHSKKPSSMSLVGILNKILNKTKITKGAKMNSHNVDMNGYDHGQRPRYMSLADLWNFFTISGENRVKRKKLSEKDFYLSDAAKPFQIAKYNPKHVADYWNHINLETSFLRQIRQSITSGLFVKLLPIILIYLATHYIYGYCIMDLYHCKNSTVSFTLPSITQEPAVVSYDNPPLKNEEINEKCKREMIEKYQETEKGFSRLLTFFIGFFVSFSIRNWFVQVLMVPRLDTLTIGVDTLLWVNPIKNQDEVKVKGEVTAQELRKTILRYCLLSWTMCLSRIRTSLKDKFKDAHLYNAKEILNQREYAQLKSENSNECWIEEWTTPLLWANKMANDLDNIKPGKNEYVMVKEVKEFSKSLEKFRLELQTLDGFNKYRVPSSIIQILVFAVYMYMICSAMASQNLHKGPAQQSDFWQAVIDIPFFALMKFSLLFGWLKIGADLQNPFGKERYGFLCIKLLSLIESLLLQLK